MTKEDKKEYDRKYYIKNKIKVNKNHRKNYIKNRNKILEQAKEYYIENKENKRESSKKYYNENKIKIFKYKKKYRLKNINRLKKYLKIWQSKNKDKMKKDYKEYYNKNRDEIIRKQKKYSKLSEVKERINRYQIHRRKTDLKYNLKGKITRAIGKSLKRNKKGYQWETLVGYKLDDLIKHLKKTMPKGYAWQDYLEGKLHIDHKIPISVFNFDKIGQIDFKKCWALKNLQLLSAKENNFKRAKLTKPFQPALKINTGGSEAYKGKSKIKKRKIRGWKGIPGP